MRAGTPPDIVRTLENTLADAMTSSKLKEWCARHGAEPRRMTSNEFVQFVTDEADPASRSSARGRRAEAPNALSCPDQAGASPPRHDARDAMHLARLLRLDEVTSVRVPSVAQEAAPGYGPGWRERGRIAAGIGCGPVTGSRNCCCASGSCTSAARPGPESTAGDCVNKGLQLGSSMPMNGRVAFDECYGLSSAVVSVGARRDRLDAAIGVMAADSEFTAVTRRLGCLRGISTLTGFALAVEIGDWSRFTGTSIGSYVGWCPRSTPQEFHGCRAR